MRELMQSVDWLIGWEILRLYFPLAIVGLWRWSSWLFKATFAIFYEPKRTAYLASVSVVTPVYNEQLEHFQQAARSWRVNNPEEIIAVIDHTNDDCIQWFRDEFSQEFAGAKLIVTHTPGKRPALKDGAEAATGDIIVLVDCDTVWANDLLTNALAPFADPAIKGVATRQEALNPRNMWEKIQNIFWSQRYDLEMPFLSRAGDAVTCLSGRTALYRRESLLPMLEGLVAETFWGAPVISGDDKYLTENLQKAGGKTYYQGSARAYTFAARDPITRLKQQTRWTRNSWRSDLRAIKDGWVWKRPALAFHLIDRSFAPLTLLLAPIYLVVSLALGHYQVAAILMGWWIVSRGVKIFPYLRRNPGHVVLLPLFVIMTFMNAVTRIYALVTLNSQGWITRWDPERMQRRNVRETAVSYLGTICIVGLLVLGVITWKGIIF